MAAALDRARQVQGVRVETGSYNVGEERPQNSPAHWRGSQSVILTGKDADSMLKLAGVLQSDGLSTSSLSYDTAPLPSPPSRHHSSGGTRSPGT